MAGFNVQEFKSIVDKRGGLMRVNQFQVSFPSPRALRGQLGASERDITFFCKAVPLPGIGILTSDTYRYGYGPIERKPYGTVYNDAMLHFYVDSQNLVRGWFRSWIKLIVNPSGVNSRTPTVNGATPYEFGYKEDYAVDIRIIAYDPEGNPRVNVVLSEAFPNYIGETMLDWDTKNNNMMLPVSLTYKDWYEEFV